jgi:ubiquinone/menaquinone biosynthesis C-methylase UbiE
MKLGEGIHGGLHGESRDGGGLLRQPRLYALTTAISFGGRRRRIYDDLVHQSGTSVGDRVLDVGCGPGYLTGRAALAIGPQGAVDGIDPSPEAITQARRGAPANTAFQIAEAEKLPYPNETFDVVLSSLAFHHIPPENRPIALREMRRVLKIGGRLLIADFRPPRNTLVRRLMGVLGGHAMQHNPVDQIPDLITAAGLRVSGQGDQRHWLRYFTATRP